MTEYNPRNRNPRRDGKHSWSEAFQETRDRKPAEPMGFRVEDKRCET